MPAGKKSAGFSALKKDIAENNIRQLYVFWGEEDYLKKHYISRLSEKLVPSGLEGFNHHVYEGRMLNADTLVDAAESLPVFSERKLIVIKDYDIYKADASLKPVLEELFADLPDYLCLVFVYETLEYKPDARRKIHGLITRNGAVCEFPLQENHDLIPWIKRRCASLEREISTDDAEYLIFLCGRQMTKLSGEIAKAAAYSNPPKITRRDIDETAAPVLDAVVYELTDAISVRDFKKAAESADRLLALRTEPIVLTASIGRQVRQLYSAKLCRQSGNAARRLMELWGFRSTYPAERLLRSAERLDIAWCRAAVRLCAEADLELKSSSADKEQILRLLLSRLSL